MIKFLLEPVAPFRLDLTVWTERCRPRNFIDRWDGETYRRTLTPAASPVEVAVIQTGPPAAPRLCVTVHDTPFRSKEKQDTCRRKPRLVA